MEAERTTERRRWRPLLDALIERFADAGGSTLAEIERAHILRTMRATGGRLTLAAERLAIARKTLYRKLEQYALEREQQQAEAR